MSDIPHKNKAKRVPFLGSFWRSQAASFLATATDFLVLIFSTEVLGFWYVFSNVLAGFSGALVSFNLGRNWAFKQSQGNIKGQAFRYALTSAMSLALNTAGLYLITEYASSHYILSKLIVSFLIGVFFNFFMFRYFVFRPASS